MYAGGRVIEGASGSCRRGSTEALKPENRDWLRDSTKNATQFFNENGSTLHKQGDNLQGYFYAFTVSSVD